MAKFIQQDFKSILNKYNLIDSWFWCRYSINPYNGCQFGCIYCDARSAKYHLPLDFENKIVVKNNVKSLLDKRISNARTLLPDVVALSGTTDAYQPAEKKYENTRRCLEVLLKHKYPVHICTKSSLVLRDLDLLEEIGQNSWCSISVTITTTNEEKAHFLDKLAPSPAERFANIHTIKAKTKHIQTGVLLIPTIPSVTDDPQELEDMVKTTKEYGADYLLFSAGLTLRDVQALWFLNHLQNRYPHLITKYEDLYHFKYRDDSYDGKYNLKSTYSNSINQLLLNLCSEYKVKYRMKRFIPDDFRKVNYTIAEKFLNTSYKRQICGGNWKTIFWSGQAIQNLRESVVDIALRDELFSIKNVNKPIEDYLKQYIEGQNE